MKSSHMSFVPKNDFGLKGFLLLATFLPVRSTLIKGVIFILFLAGYVNAYSQITVTNTNDTGAGSLRQSIIDANASSGETIDFNIPGVGPWVISPVTSLPAITAAGTVIDATTQPGWDMLNDEMVEIDGATNTVSASGISIQATNVEIYGFKISGFAFNVTSAGISIVGDSFDNTRIGAPGKGNVLIANRNGIYNSQADGTIIQGNHVGIDATGTIVNLGTQNLERGIYFLSTSEDAQIGGDRTIGEGNVISGNGVGAINNVKNGVQANNAPNLTVQGNFIGTDITGTQALGNTNIGIWVDGALTTNAQIGGADLRLGNVVAGSGDIGIYLSAPAPNLLNNYVGIALDGTTILPNSNDGIRILNSGVGAVIRSNVVAGNTNNQVRLQGTTSGTIIEDNYIGTDPTGVNALAFGVNGIFLDILGLSANISIINNHVFAPQRAIAISRTGNVTVHGNYIGVQPDGETILNDVGGGNVSQIGVGILDNNNASDNHIGGTSAGEANFIGYCTTAAIDAFSGQRNQFIGNQMIGNTVGISLIFSANGSQLPPVIGYVRANEVYGRALGAADGDLVHVYVNSTTEYNQGRFYLGEAVVSSEEWTLSGTFDPTLIHQATLTTSVNGTSPFSMHYVVRSNSDDNVDGTLRNGINQLLIPALRSSISFNMPGDGSGGSWIIPKATAYPDINRSISIDGSTQPGWDFNSGLMPHLQSASCNCPGLYFLSTPDVAVYGMIIDGFTNGISDILGTPLIVGDVGRGNILINNSSQGLAASRFASIKGNYIGIDHTGAAAPNGGGLSLGGGIGSIVGGPSVGERNIISSNTNGGITTNTGGSHIIENNYIGVGLNGNTDQGNGGNGVFIATTTGGVTFRNNVISANGLIGIEFQGGGNYTLHGNHIGVGVDGTTPLGNGQHGVRFNTGSNSTLGGNNAGEPNIIANNGTSISHYGVFLLNGISNNIVLTQNSIYNNFGKGIFLTTGANSGILPPSIISVTTTEIIGSGVDGDLIELFEDNTSVSTLQGRTFLGSATVAGGIWSISGTFNINSNHSATATRSGAGTSEFSFMDPFIVTNTDDSGLGSLRWCLTNANNIAGVNTISFNISNLDPNYNLDGGTGNETWTIYPVTDLPAITQGVVLDATTQPGAGNYKIKIDGQGTRNRGFSVTGGYVEVYGFYLTGFNANGSSAAISIIHLGGSPSTIGAVNKGNVINSSRNGITFSLRAGCTIKGNLIGTDETGEIDLGNSVGIDLATNGSAQIIGGDLAGEGNLISGNNTGISANASGGHSIRGNYIGTNKDGTSALGNNVGMSFGTSGNNSFINNLISGNSSNAINLVNSANNTFQGNIIGEGSDGSPMGNNRGIEGFNTQGNTIGGILAGQGNTIVNNTNEGILFTNGGCVNNVIIGNTINCNGLGIDLSGVANNNIQPPTINEVTSTTVGGTGLDGEEIHIYRDNSGCLPAQGEEYLGTALVTGGVWQLTGLSITIGSDVLTATATNATDGTSEFIGFTFPFITTWQSDNSGTSTDTQVTIPTFPSETYNYQVHWEEVGDPTHFGDLSGLTGNTVIEFTTAGTYRVEISGQFPHFYSNNSNDGAKLLSVEQWGSNTWTSMYRTFDQCNNLRINAPDAPDLSNVTDMREMFSGASSFNDDISAWDVSNVEDMGLLFYEAISFNQPINSWNVGNVVNMGEMFVGADAFNQPLDNWDVGKVQFMNYMFSTAPSFNQPINSWDVSMVTDMSGMFSFNSSFNQPLNNWNVSNVSKMDWMFADNGAFNQSLGDWDIQSVTDMTRMLRNSALSEANYDATLIGWADDNGGTETIPANIILDADGLTYCAGAAARAILTSAPYNWSITDAGVCTFLELVVLLDGSTIITSGASINFGQTPTQTPIRRTLTIENPSPTEVITFSSITVDNSAFEIVQSPSFIGPLASEDFIIELTATSEGSFSGQAILTSNFADFFINLSGEVQANSKKINVYNVVTPNGDGKHDFLKIEGITEFTGNRVSIFDRWGRIVYQATNYDNSEVKFEGYDTKGNNQLLPNGTYFYVIETGKDKTSGYLQISTNN